MTARTPPRTSVPRPNVPRTPVGHDDSACRTFVSRPPPPGRVSKGGPLPPCGRFKGVWGKYEIPPEFFFGGLGVYSFNSERIHPQMPPSILGTPGRPASPPQGALSHFLLFRPPSMSTPTTQPVVEPISTATAA